MQIKLFLLSLAFLLLGLVLTSNSRGRASDAFQGNTGAPGDNSRVCASCHSGASFNVNMNLSLLDTSGQEVDAYIPGQTYTVKVAIETASGGSPAGWGFQMVCLDAPLNIDGEDLENWMDSGRSNNYKIASARGRQYVEHDGVSSENTFEVTWLAPDADTGPVSFYAAGNGVNLNGRTSGDDADQASLEIRENITSSTSALWQASIALSPNPAQHSLRVHIPENFTGSVTINDANGRTMISHRQVQAPFEEQIDAWPIGTYVIAFHHIDGSSRYLTFVKSE